VLVFSFRCSNYSFLYFFGARKPHKIKKATMNFYDHCCKKLSTILIGWIMTPDYVINEMERGGEKFRRKKLYCIMIRYVAPVMMFVLFLQSTGILS